jgi:hypothetical protein
MESEGSLMFKLHAETPTHYTIKHPSGDVLKIAKKGLSGELHAHIKKMAGGGQVESDDSDDSSSDSQKAPVIVNVGTGPQQQSNPVGPQPDANPTGPQQQKNDNSPQMASPVPITPGQDIKSQPGKSQPQYQNVPPMAMQQAQPPLDMNNLPNIGNQVQQDIGQFQAGAEQQAQTAGIAGQQQAAVYGQQAQQAQQMNDMVMKNHSQINGELMKLAKETNEKKFNFNQSWQNKSRGDKIMASLGMILAGAGSGLTGQPNEAFKLLNQEMERDVREQIANSSNKKTAFGMYQQALGNSDQAAKMSMLALQTITAAKANQITSNNAGPAAEAQKNLLLGQMLPKMQQDAYQLSLQRAQYQALTGGGQNQGQNGQQVTGNQGPGGVDPKTMIRFSHVLGASDKDKDEMYKDYDSLSKMKSLGQDALGAFDKVSQMKLGGTFSPQERDTLVEPVLAQMVKDSEGRITPQDTKMIESLFPNKLSLNPMHPSLPTMSGDTTNIKREQLLKFLKQKMTSSKLSAFGIPMPQIDESRPHQ